MSGYDPCNPDRSGTSAQLTLFVVFGVALPLAVLIWTPWPPVKLVAFAFAAAGVTAVGLHSLRGHHLAYRVTSEGIEVQSRRGPFRIEKEEIVRAYLAPYRIGRGFSGPLVYANYVVAEGRLDGKKVLALVGRRSGRGVWLELTGGRTVILNPVDPRRCLALLGLKLNRKGG